MFELVAEEYRRAEPLFRATRYGALAHSVIEGHSRGRIFVDDMGRPKAALMQTPFGYSYLAGDARSDGFTHALYGLFSEQLIRGTLDAGEHQFLLFFPSDAWRGALLDAFRAKTPLIISKARLRSKLASRLVAPNAPCAAAMAFSTWLFSAK